ncbi:MAG: peptidase, partial [Gemmatimonadetes bacterium]|nr:peptidase [Gemmatimonadota bacterium]
MLTFAGFAVIATAAAAQGVKPFDVVNLDTTCAPCKDFFQFANAGWIKRNPIPPAYSSWGSFTELGERNRVTLRRILDDAAQKAGTAPAGSNLERLGV